MIRCLAGASSSATITQKPSDANSGMGVLSDQSQRQRYFDLRSTIGAPVHGKTGFSIGIKPCQTLPCYGEPHAAGIFELPTRRKSHAVVKHANIKSIPDAVCRHDHRSARSSPGNSVPDCILHEWLNEETGYGSIFHFRRDLRLDPQVVSEADLLDRQIVFEKGHLFRQRDFLLVF